jgi:hypothetical protein
MAGLGTAKPQTAASPVDGIGLEWFIRISPDIFRRREDRVGLIYAI